MKDVVKNVFEAYKSTHDGNVPSELVIYRSGVAEGSYQAVLTLTCINYLLIDSYTRNSIHQERS